MAARTPLPRTTTPRTPSYCRHKASGQAVVTIDGRDLYLGPYGSLASRAEYDRIIAEWLGNGRTLPTRPAGGAPADLTVNEILIRYLRFADGYYVKNGKPTTEATCIRQSIRPLRELYGDTPARDFGPLALKAVRERMIAADLCRAECNKRTGRIVRAFKWAVENELVPPSVYHGLKAVAGLRKGRCEAREKPPIKPVPEAFVEAVRPVVSRQVRAMIDLQRLTGMRPGEVVQMRTCDLDTSGAVWVYTPPSHKTEHHGKERPIYLGPRAQEVLRPWLRLDTTAPLFNPTEAMAEKSAERRAGRKTPLTPSQRARRPKTNRKRAPGDCYTTRSYYHAVRAACKRAGVPDWHPNQLRHNAATALRKQFGIDATRAILGHSTPAVTEVYAEIDRGKAAEIMGRIG